MVFEPNIHTCDRGTCKMATFILNEGYRDERSIDAVKWEEDRSFVVFKASNGLQVYAYPTAKVVSIERKAD